MNINNVNAHALQHAETLLKLWLPDGKVVGSEFIAKNPTRSDENPGSFKINIQTGKWGDFALDDEKSKGVNFMSLYQYIKHLTFDDAKLALEDEIVRLDLVNDPMKSARVTPKIKPVSSMLASAFEFPAFIRDGDHVSDYYSYHDSDGKVVFYVAKTILANGAKEVIPLTLDHNGLVSLGLPTFSTGTPLYNRHLLTPGISIHFGEGEKVANHLQNFYPNTVATTTQGGCCALLKSDLSPLWQAAEITIFPDADDAGKKYALQLGLLAQLKGIKTSILDVEIMGWTNGEDIADFPELTHDDVAQNIIPFEHWLEKIPVQLKTDLTLSALASLPKIEYEQARKKAANQVDIRVNALDKEVDNLRPSAKKPEESPTILLTPEERAALRHERWSQIKEIASQENILRHVAEVCQQKLNVIGEEALIKLLYLGVVSRLLKAKGDCPVSIFCKGSSSGGKSYVMGVVLSLFRENDSWLRFGSMSQKAMIYDDTCYQHKILFLPEINQLLQDKDSDITMIMKSILSEHQLNHRVVECDPLTNKRQTVTIQKQGPVGLFAGTTRDFTDPEIETRVLSVYVNESQDHTKAILKGITRSKTHPTTSTDEDLTDIFTQWHQFDEWLELHPTHIVSIPYFGAIVAALEYVPVRFRRDIPHGLSGLIKASALIHCANREESEEGYVIANLEDYENAKQAIEACLALSANSAEVPARTMVLNWVIEKIKSLPANERKVKMSSREIAVELGIHQSTITRHISSLIKSNELVNLELNNFKPYQLILGDECEHLSGDILPTKEQVEERWTST